MAWTWRDSKGNETVISDGSGWTQAAKSCPLVIQNTKYGNGRMNSGPSGKNLKPAKVHARAMAEMARKYAPKVRTAVVNKLDGNSKSK